MLENLKKLISLCICLGIVMSIVTSSYAYTPDPGRVPIPISSRMPLKYNIDNPKSGQIASGILDIYGWALRGLGTSGIKKIEVLVDGTYKGTATYGYERLDVYQVYPSYNNKNSGFLFKLDTNTLSSGSHSLQLRITDTFNITTTTWAVMFQPIPSSNLQSRISCGGNTTLALKNDGTIMGWGDNSCVQIGNDGIRGSSVFYPVKAVGTGPGGKRIKAVSTGRSHTLALTEDGQVLACGDNKYGQLGTGVQAEKHTFVPIDFTAKVKAIEAGHYASAALDEEGKVWLWGWNYRSMLGDWMPVGSSRYWPVLPTNPLYLSGVKAVSCGIDNLAILASDGNIYTTGSNSWGQLGNGSSGGESGVPQKVVGITGTIVAIACGNYRMMALTSDGSVWVWGYEAGVIPVKVPNLTDIKAISASEEHSSSLALKSDGTVWQIGILSGDIRQVKNADGSAFTEATAISEGLNHYAIVKNNGDIYTLGRNENGALGVGESPSYAYTPVKVSMNLLN